ncbi:MAG: type I-G CRISPR-associated helicase/endonuclease Cas3g, partial [Acidimicrobiales bacterium]
MSFEGFVEQATGFRPYPYQIRLAEGGLPEVLDVETGAGKTAAVVLAWLWRRRHPDTSVRKATPHWLVICEPMRTLTEQVERDVHRWVGALGLEEEVLVHVAMGGREDPGDVWRRHPERDAIVIGTLDMLLSRALNRGYATGRFTWPIDFGLLNNGTHWVFDEVQAMGPALPTSRQLEGLRRHFGTALPTASTWMSATVDPGGLRTIDNPDVASSVSLTGADRSAPGLGRRLAAAKSVHQVEVSAEPTKRAADIAAALVEHHRPGSLSLAVANTVGTARAVHAALDVLAPKLPHTLLHSRFRPADRQSALEAALAEVDASGPGRIVVSTQVVEAGVDVSAATLLTEAAPWPSIVQRAGRCNRDGEAIDARLLWAPVAPSASAPYLAEDIEAASAELRELEGESVTSSSMRERPVPIAREVHPVLRRADLVALFDTAPDLSGNDVDVGPYLRDGEDLDVYVAWRALGSGRPGDADQPTVEELCPVPLGKELREWMGIARAWRYDHLSERWVVALRSD